MIERALSNYKAQRAFGLGTFSQVFSVLGISSHFIFGRCIEFVKQRFLLFGAVVTIPWDKKGGCLRNCDEEA